MEGFFADLGGEERRLGLGLVRRGDERDLEKKRRRPGNNESQEFNISIGSPMEIMNLAIHKTFPSPGGEVFPSTFNKIQYRQVNFISIGEQRHFHCQTPDFFHP